MILNQYVKQDLEAILQEDEDVYSKEDLITFLYSLISNETPHDNHVLELWQYNAKHLLILRDSEQDGERNGEEEDILLQVDLPRRRVGRGVSNKYWPVIHDEDNMELQTLCTFFLATIQAYKNRLKEE